MHVIVTVYIEFIVLMFKTFVFNKYWLDAVKYLFHNFSVSFPTLSENSKFIILSNQSANSPAKSNEIRMAILITILKQTRTKIPFPFFPQYATPLLKFVTQFPPKFTVDKNLVLSQE